MRKGRYSNTQEGEKILLWEGEVYTTMTLA